MARARDTGRILAGRYRVGALVGSGGMAEVYRGDDLRLGRSVAIKLLSPERAIDPAFRLRFRRAAEIVSRMSHPTIVRVLDAGEETVVDGGGQEVQRPYIVMEFVEGRVLRDVLADGPVGLSQAAEILGEVLTALEFSHRAGVIHHDIKPGNIMVMPNGHAKVMDFGISRAANEADSSIAASAEAVGTVAYFSPEQARGEQVDARSDLYSAGVLLFELLTGTRPFDGPTAVAVAYQHVTDAPPIPSERNAAVSPAFDAVVGRALAKDRAERYQTAAEFRDDVVAAAAGRMPVRAVEQATVLADSVSAAIESLGLPQPATIRYAAPQPVNTTQRRPPALWIWAGVIALLVVMASVAYWALNLQPFRDMPAGGIRIPNLVGQTFADASKRLDGLGLPVVRVNEVSDSVPANQVIRTDPGANEIVSSNTQVTLYVSSGRLTAIVPHVGNLSVDAAKQALEKVGFRVGSQVQVSSPTVAAGTVVDTSPAAGATADTGSAVTLRVSSGTVTLPDFTGKPAEAAAKSLQGSTLQLTPQLQGDQSCPPQSGLPVMKQSPAPGEVPQHSTVTLIYCSSTGKPTPTPTR